MSNNHIIQTLHLDQDTVGPDTDQSIHAALCSNCTLRHLDLSKCEFLSAVGSAIFMSLAKNKSLQYLDVSKNDLSLCAGCIGDMLRENSTLEHLDLSATNVEATTVLGIIEALHHNFALKYLSFAVSPIALLATDLASMLTVNRSLQFLNLRSTGLTQSDASRIGSALAQNTTLTGLDLTANNLGAGGSFLKQIEENTTLRALCVTGFCEEVECAISNMLKRNAMPKLIVQLEVFPAKGS